MKLKVLSGVAAAALCGAFLAIPGAQAAEGDGVRVGILTCQVEGGTGFVFGSSKDLRCHFESARGKGERYVGAINKFGLDIGVTGPAVQIGRAHV